MGQKKKNHSALAPARKGRSSKPKPRSVTRKARAKKEKIDETALAVLNADKLKELYITMVKCRMLTERIRGMREAMRKQVRTIPGLEATLVGAGAHLLPQDCISLEHNGFLASLIKGTPLRLILARIHKGHAGHDVQQPSASANGTGTATSHSMSTGLALAQEMKGTGSVTLMFASNDSSSAAFEPEGMALAATQKLPIVCLVESSFDERAGSHILPVPSDSHGVGTDYYPKITVDGCDVVAVFRVAQEAIRRARQGHGPALIECMTSRVNGPANGTARYIANDPLPFMEQYLRRRKLWSGDWSRRMITAFSKELEAALASANAPPDLNADFDHVYSADNWSVSVKTPQQQISASPTP